MTMSDITSTTSLTISSPTNSVLSYNYNSIPLALIGDEQRYAKSIDPHRGIHPKLYFSFVKSRLTKIEKEKIRKRLRIVEPLLVQAKEINQEAYYQELAKEFAFLLREAEVLACGFDTIIKKASIEKFRSFVKDTQIDFSTVAKFPRAIPNKIQKKLSALQGKSLFDEYYILYNNPSKEVVKTNKEKIQEKDPILFGNLFLAPETFFYIADWEDEYCNLTLDSFLSKMKENNKDFELETIKPLNSESIAKIRKEAEERALRLSNARPSNYLELMKEEDKPKKEKRVSLFQRIFRRGK